jgi:hypothetical protein
MRAEAVWNVGRDDITVVTVPEPVADDPELRQARARLQMYSERDVRLAFDRCGEADRQFIMAFIGWRKAAELNVKVHRGDVPAHQAVEGSELVRLRKTVEAASDDADAEQEKLVALVAEKVGRLPRYERRAWRRLKKPQMD